MAITITNTLALAATHQLARNQAALQQSLLRLSTGYRINSGADDPAGLIASESLRSEMAATSAQITNAQRADQVLATADGALGEVSNLLINLQSLVVASANSAAISPDEIAANQLQVDSILSSINRISNTATFAGQHLLGGQFAYQLSAGPNFQSLRNLNIQSATLAPAGFTVQIQLLASAQHATLLFHGSPTGLSAPVSLSLAGNVGTVQLSFASATSASTIASAINQLSASTGVTASANGNDVAFLSTGYGAQQFVSIQSSSPAFQTQSLAGIDSAQANGQNASVLLNGQPVASNGLTVTARSGNLNASFAIDPANNTPGYAASFSIIGGGANFAIDGPASTSSIALAPVSTSNLGFLQQPSATFSLADLATSGSASLTSGHLDISQQIVNNAILQVASTRGSIGAYRQYDLQSTINSLNVKYENLSSAESSIRDTDFAAETATLARAQILAAASQFALSAAQQNQKIILKLLGQ